MPLKIIRQDIAKIKCDAIVNPTDPYFSHSGGVDAQIHAAAGPELYRYCLNLEELSVGEAIATSSFELPCKYVIHTVSPTWKGGSYEEETLLKASYSSCLKVAKEKKCKSVAFPLISSGTFGFPKDMVLRIALDTISSFLFSNEILVYLVVFDKTAYSISEKLFSDITSFIDDTYSEWKPSLYDSLREQRNYRSYQRKIAQSEAVPDEITMYPALAKNTQYPKENKKGLEDMLKEIDMGFAETLFYYIDKKGLTDVECYKRANVDKKTFSKIKCNKNYRPSKVTAVSFAIALRLDLDETNHLLGTVGMCLSRSSKFDIIIEYFITTGNYKDIFDVNETLYQFDQVTLGV